MPKKRIILVGILLVFCLFGQWLLRSDQATADSSDGRKISALQATQSAAPTTSLEGNGKPDSKYQNPDNLRHQLMRQLFIMILFVALIGFAVWWFARKYGHGLMGGKGKLVTVTETVSLGPRKMVHILEVGSRKLLLGSTADSIRFLADITDAIAIPSAPETAEGRQDE